MVDFKVKIFRDNVHGYIKIPQPFVNLFIDTEIFQRLRSIEQTGMRVLYPSARHDRFIHSLGTYHLGCIAFESFKNNVRLYFSDHEETDRNHYNVYNEPKKNQNFWDKCGLLFNIACLLHDCGHAPFSHTLEFLFEYDPNRLRTSLKAKLLQYLGSAEFKNDFKNQGTEHERMSALVVCTEFDHKIDKLIGDCNLYIAEDSDDVEFVARMIIGCKYEIDSKSNRIKNCLISLLNSSSIDVDSLDYIIRDSKLSGIDNMSVDVERLLNSLTIIEKTSFYKTRVNKRAISTNVLNGSLESFDNTNKAIVNIQCIGNTRAENFSGQLNGKLSLSGLMRFEEEVALKEANNNIININGASCKKISQNSISQTELFGTTEDWVKVHGVTIELDDKFNGKINLKADKIEFDSTYINGNLTGLLTGDLLGYWVDAGGELKCELGFHKSSLSVIQNVVVARNYEYQWIYSHHKVVYYSNYLIIELFCSCVKYLLEQNGRDPKEYEDVMANILSWETMIQEPSKPKYNYDFNNTSFFRVTDSDLMHMFRQCEILCRKNNELNGCYKLLSEYYTRNYKKSLWKSFAEFNIFFSDYSEDEKAALFELIKTKTKNGVLDKYGYFKKDWEDKFNNCGMKNVVWVNGNSKLKRLDPDNTFILFKNDTLNYKTVSYENDSKINQKINLIYIYYEKIDEKSHINIQKIKNFLRNELRNFI